MHQRAGAAVFWRSVNLPANPDFLCLPTFLGVQNERRPFTFVRGCATDIFELATVAGAVAGPSSADRGMLPAEIDYLHRAQLCLELPLGHIWPQLGSDANRQTGRWA